VLRHVAGGPAIRQTQLGKLAELAHQPGTVIQVLPFTAPRRWHIPSATAAAGS
jgi:hypothetical protein